jgi:hypothetical protein
MPTVVSGGRRKEMNRFLDHYHCESEDSEERRGKEKTRSEGREGTRSGKWVCMR